jgi:hypothetical protein
MKFIELSKQGKHKGKHVAIVDDDDYERINKFRWHRHSSGYAIRKDRINRKELFMHRDVVNCPDDMDVDHKDMDKLNNQKSNLRICTNAENIRNRNAPKNNTSGYKGVCWLPDRKRWAVHVKEKFVGHFFSKEEAARAYDRKAKELFGEFARLNFPEA